MQRLCLSLSVLILGCLALPASLHAQNGKPEQRVTPDFSVYPWRTIGYVNTGCTGTLIGKNLVLTAAHYVIDPKTKDLRKDITYFYAKLVKGEPTLKSWIGHIYWGTNDPQKFPAHDWAILVLNDNLGDQLGWMGVTEDTYSVATLVTYSGDFKTHPAPSTQLCNIREKGDLFYHDGKTAIGAAGGPLFVVKNQVAIVVGINTAEDEKAPMPLSNAAVQGRQFLEKVKELKGEGSTAQPQTPQPQPSTPQPQPLAPAPAPPPQPK